MRAIREEIKQIAILGVPISATRMIVALTRITVCCLSLCSSFVGDAVCVKMSRGDVTVCM